MKNIKCGENTLSVTVKNNLAGSPAALIFSISQDQAGCYKCLSPFSYYNKEKCKCECTQTCDCSDSYRFYDYPVCGCKCSSTMKCPASQYFNEYSCSCKCNPVACLPGYEKDDSKCLCKSKCVKTPCSQYQTWDNLQCKCVCSKITHCP